MAIVKKISELTPKGSALANTDLLIVGVDNGTDYDLKSVTGAQVLGNVVSQTITDGVTTKAPSENVVFDALALKANNTDLNGYVKTTTNQTIAGEKTFTSNTVHDLALKIKHGTGSSSIGYTGIGANVNQLIVGVTGATQTLTFPNIANYIYTFPSATGTLALTSDLTNQVPYTGATQNVDLGEFELKAGQLSLDITPTGTAAVGTTRWNDALGSSETTLKGGSVVIKNGVDLVARVVNKVTPNTTLTKANYQVVKVSGAQGQRLAVNLAQANNDNNSADTLGIVCETILTNQEGFIITVGQLENVNTTGSLQGETWVDGDVLYLSPTTAGKITNIKPTGATGHIVILGYVEYAHAVNGKIYVKIMNGWELDELHNVSISNPLDKQLLSYENSTSLWKNKSVTTADIADSTNKRYVTDANLTVIGNTSGTNTGDQDLSSYQPYTTATTGSVISFVVPQVYNSVASPSSSNITDSLTNAKIGIVQKIYHNHTVAPTFPAGWVKMGTATYTTSTLNVIFAEWVSSTRVEYWITKPS